MVYYHLGNKVYKNLLIFDHVSFIITQDMASKLKSTKSAVEPSVSRRAEINWNFIKWKQLWIFFKFHRFFSCQSKYIQLIIFQEMTFPQKVLHILRKWFSKKRPKVYKTSFVSQGTQLRLFWKFSKILEKQILKIGVLKAIKKT